MAEISFRSDDAQLDHAWVAAALAHHYGVTGALVDLPGEYDLNLAVECDGQRRYVFKIMRADCELGLVDLQCRALEHVLAVDASVPVPAVVTARDGERIVSLATPDGATRFAWLITALPGQLYAEVRPQNEPLVRAVGAALARLDKALQSFVHPALERESKWDLAAAGWILEYLHAIVGDKRRAQVSAIGTRFRDDLSPRLKRLPTLPIHNDLNDYNLLIAATADGSRTVSGLLDFGDLLPGARVSDIAIAAAYIVLDQSRPIAMLAAFVAGYHAVWPLSEAELALIYPLLLTRLAVSVTNSGLGKLARPEDAYVTVSERGAWAFLEESARYPEEWVLAALRRACGYPGYAAAADVRQWLGQVVARPVLSVELGSATILDISIGGSASPDDPRVFDMAALEAHVAQATRSSTAAIGRYAEPRLIYTESAFVRQTPTGRVRRTVHLGLDVFVPAGSSVHAPLDGIVVDVAIRGDALDYGGVVALEHRTGTGVAFYTLYGHLAHEVTGRVTPGQAVAAGDVIGLIGSPAENGAWPSHLHLQLALTSFGRGVDWPGVADPDDLDDWLECYPNPAMLLGLAPESVDGRPRPAAQLLAERQLRFSHNLKTSYKRPIVAVRGSKHFLYDAYGREYLDAYNNVPQVGHCHPRLVRVLAEQARLLNTNTRYLQESHLAYGAALAACFPAPLEVCFFVNSGSEANELALRLARAYTAARDTIVLEEGYHGNTNTAIALSHYKFAGPGGTGPEPWVHVAALPDSYRGSHRGADAGARYADDVELQLRKIAAGSGKVAAFLCETFPSVGGQIVLPEGYLARVYAAVRAAGGLCIADEVQTGFGRLGEWRFGFESQQVVPDIVVLGKPIGNGFPIGAVVTTRAIADAFANGMEFFSTFGGSTLACAVGLEVLAIEREEGLQANAARVGGRLKQALVELAGEFPLIGEVRGAGLFLGLELVEDRQTRKPATGAAAYLVERLREHRVLIGTEGHANNVLKVRPPLTFDDAATAQFVQCLRLVLAESAAQPCR